MHTLKVLSQTEAIIIFILLMHRSIYLLFIHSQLFLDFNETGDLTMVIMHNITHAKKKGRGEQQEEKNLKIIFYNMITFIAI